MANQSRNRLPFYRKLSTQLVVAVSMSFIAIIMCSLLFLNNRVTNTLKEQTYTATIQSFQQFDYNIDQFCAEMELLSRRLISNTELSELIFSVNQSMSEQTVLTAALLRQLGQTVSDYSYIDSIVFYNSNDLTLIAAGNQNIIRTQEEERGRFYEQEYERMKGRRSGGLCWAGGYTNEDFNIPVMRNSRLDPDAASIPYLTAYRPVYWGRHTGMIIINIDLEHFTNIYNHPDSEYAAVMNTYIVDEAGQIISHVDRGRLGEERLGKTAEAQRTFELPLTAPFSYDEAESQVLLYPLDIGGWTMINETPHSVILKNTNYIRHMITIVLLLGILLTLFFASYWVYQITRPLTQVIRAMEGMEQGELGISVRTGGRGGNEIRILITQFNKMSASIQKLVSENERMQESRRQLEVQILKSQINPHFLYNTLNTIKWMALIQKADNVAESIAVLSELLSPVFKDTDRLWTLDREVKYIENYVTIMNYRFGGKLNLLMKIPSQLTQNLLPKFILQPLVENAISHGLAQRQDGMIEISGSEQGGKLYLTVRDNGVGINSIELGRLNDRMRRGEMTEKVGIRNVHQRIMLHYGAGYGLELDSEEGLWFAARCVLRAEQEADSPKNVE